MTLDGPFPVRGVDRQRATNEPGQPTALAIAVLRDHTDPALARLDAGVGYTWLPIACGVFARAAARISWAALQERNSGPNTRPEAVQSSIPANGYARP